MIEGTGAGFERFNQWMHELLLSAQAPAAALEGGLAAATPAARPGRHTVSGSLTPQRQLALGGGCAASSARVYPASPHWKGADGGACDALARTAAASSAAQTLSSATSVAAMSASAVAEARDTP